jgi:hypothetical protein
VSKNKKVFWEPSGSLYLCIKNCIIMKEKKYVEPKAGRRLRKAVDGPKIMKLFAWMTTAEVARRLALKVKQKAGATLIGITKTCCTFCTLCT